MTFFLACGFVMRVQEIFLGFFDIISRLVLLLSGLLMVGTISVAIIAEVGLLLVWLSLIRVSAALLEISLASAFAADVVTSFADVDSINVVLAMFWTFAPPTLARRGLSTRLARIWVGVSSASEKGTTSLELSSALSSASSAWFAVLHDDSRESQRWKKKACLV